MTMIQAMANDLINSLDEIAFEQGPSDSKKLESMQNLLYQYNQIQDAMSIRQEEYINKLMEEGDEFPSDYDGPLYQQPNMRRM